MTRRQLIPGWRRRSGQGAAASFDGFVADHGEALFRVAVILSADVRAGEDLYQETLQRLASRWGSIDNPVAWSRRVMHNLSVDRYRAARSRPAEVPAGEAVIGLSDHRSADQLEAIEVRPALLRALSDLTDSQRLVVALRFLEDRSEAEVAQMLEVPVGTVKSTASRAVGRLRRHPSLARLFSGQALPDDEAAG